MTHIEGLALKFEQPSRTPVTPPELARDTPILHVLHPSDPVASRRLGLDLQFARTGSLWGLI